MKLKLSEYKSKLDSIKKMTGEARIFGLDMLKGAEVVDDTTGAALDVELIELPAGEAPAAAAGTTKTLTEDEIDRRVQKALDTKLAATTPNRPNITVTETTRKSGIPACVKRFGKLKHFKSVDRDGRSADERAARFGMWAMATLNNGSSLSAACKSWCEDNGLTIKVSTESNNGSSSVLIPEEFSTDLIDLREQYGVFRKYANIRKMTGDVLRIPRRVSGLTAYAVAEGAAGTESQKNWDLVELVAKDWMVLTRYTNQLSMDAAINIGDDLAGEIAYAYAQKEDAAGFIGDGTSTYSGIQGVLTKLLKVWTTSGGVGLIKSAGTGFGTNYNGFTLGDFNNVVSALPQYADTPNAAWFVHKTFWGSVMQRLETAAGGNRVGDITDGARTPKFLGYPVVISQVLPKASATSQVVLAFGDLSLAASFGDRQQDAIAMSEHASIGGQSVFERNEIAVRGTERFDINVHDVGDGSTNAGPVVGLITNGS